MSNHVELASAAQRDLHRLGPGPQRERILEALVRGLAATPQPANLDAKPIVGASPWLRLRVGDYRVLYRPLTPAELAAIAQGSEAREVIGGFLVHRIIRRRDLDRAVETLP
jgi:mRNA-degrading endonuclease RelE of RelBE toxin-antitoxin system